MKAAGLLLLMAVSLSAQTPVQRYYQAQQEGAAAAAARARYEKLHPPPPPGPPFMLDGRWQGCTNNILKLESAMRLNRAEKTNLESRSALGEQVDTARITQLDTYYTNQVA